jgi:hypothetical protein
MDRWTFILTKLDHTPLGEVNNATARKLSISLSKPSVASFSVKPSNPLLKYLFEDEDKLLQVWQNGTIRYWGPVISAQFATQDDGSQPSIAVTSADPAWRLAKRLAGKSKGGESNSGDKGNTAKHLIDVTNSEDDTEIETESVESASTGTYVAGPYKPVLTCIGELAHGLDGFDWYIAPKTGSSSKIGTLKLAGVVGSEKPAAIFEYGTGRKNMRNMSFIRDLSGTINRAFHIPDEGLEGEGGEVVVSAEDATSIAARGLLEETVDLTGVTNKTLREEWCQNNVQVRKVARRVLAMTADFVDPANAAHVPQFGTDYFIGDRVPARAMKEGVVLFNGLTRVYQVDIEPDDNGVAKVTPILVDESGE